MNNKPDSKKYFDSMHRLGRWATVITLIVFFGTPTIVCLHYDIMPTVGQVIMASGALIVLCLPGAIAELVSEVPVLGSSYYLSSITGNVTNLKLPAAIEAQRVADVEKGTQEADAVTGIATGITSLVTMLMLAIGVLLLVPLQPVLQSEAVTTASNYVLPALFGYLALNFFNTSGGGGAKIYGIPKSLILPFLVAVLMNVFMPDFYGMWQGFITLAFIPCMFFLTKFMYKKGMIKVEMPGETESEAE